MMRPAVARPLWVDENRMLGWKPLGTVYVVNYCGYGSECVSWPEPEGYWGLVAVWVP